ncbi:MAG: DUF2125 domain-containing protein [Paracoccaceae bacterium]
MRFLKWVGIVFLVLAVGIWFAASYALKKGAESVFAGLVQDGLVAETTDLSVGGFPTRLDLAMTGLNLTNPKTGEGWQAPSLHISAPSWAPWHVTADLPATQVLTVEANNAMQAITVTSDGLAASVRVRPDITANLQEITAGGAALQAASSLGWTVGAEDLRLRLLVDGQNSKIYALTLEARNIAPDASLATALAAVNLPDLPVSDLPAQVDSVALVMQLHLTQPLDLTSALRPELAGVDLQALTAVWGPLQIAASGSLRGDANGFAAGQIDIAVTNWNRLPALLAATGAVQPAVVTLVSNGMKALADAGGDPMVLTVPLIMQEGRTTFGPFPLGEAPRMARGAGG